ncbi:hypothetical protein [Pseudomonas moorei]|uniref:Uncharacterized protein n=1 Tax=Pseudomonas moorei TaxID=395599 RepID=A0A1H1FLV6_9PSED|nr:hypothetical protein [Pseudomonas moorei]KAB0509627.1 hypothetical protein F7R06_00995 [Pseudomonas moorei]SDR01860.1 hypothetical protein SAMN04490195_2773 [Pseudomonas moorei]
MTDYSELKKAAEACEDLLPLRYMECPGALYIRNDNGIVFDVHQNRSFPEFMAQNKDYADLVLAANPATVLALLAEIDRLRGIQPAFPPRPPEGEGLPRYGLRWNGPQQPLAVLMTDGYWTPWHLADQLKAEVARSTEREIHQLAEIEALRKNSARYLHLKATWDDGLLLERLGGSVLPEDWDAEIDKDMSKESP